jgi:hypothetical protein
MNSARVDIDADGLTAGGQGFGECDATADVEIEHEVARFCEGLGRADSRSAVSINGELLGACNRQAAAIEQGNVRPDFSAAT